MKTTIDIPEPTLKKVAAIAASRGLTLKDMVNLALLDLVKAFSKKERGYELEDRSVSGGWLSNESKSLNWDELRQMSERKLYQD